MTPNARPCLRDETHEAHAYAVAEADTLRTYRCPGHYLPAGSRHAAYAALPGGRWSRFPFASFPHAEAARRWVASHPDTVVRFVPALPAEGA